MATNQPVAEFNHNFFFLSLKRKRKINQTKMSVEKCGPKADVCQTIAQ